MDTCVHFWDTVGGRCPWCRAEKAEAKAEAWKKAAEAWETFLLWNPAQRSRTATESELLHDAAAKSIKAARALDPESP